MPLTVKWDGTTKTPPSYADERTSKLGTFVSAKKVSTYYPVPSAYSALVPVSYLYKVPAKFSCRPDLIALDVYGSADLWWVIFWANNIVDPFGRPLTDEVIKIVDMQSLRNLLD